MCSWVPFRFRSPRRRNVSGRTLMCSVSSCRMPRSPPFLLSSRVASGTVTRRPTKSSEQPCNPAPLASQRQPNYCAGRVLPRARLGFSVSLLFLLPSFVLSPSSVLLPSLVLLEVGEGSGFVGHWPGCLLRVDVFGWVEPVRAAGTGDIPVVVMEEHVVMSAEQDAVCQVG